MYTNQTVYSGDISNGIVYTDNLNMNNYYRITITEQFDGGESKDYVRYITTEYEMADMPEYVLNPSSGDTEYISIVDTDKYQLATQIDEDGRKIFDADIAAFTNVPANEWQEYCNSLENDKIYKVETGNGKDTKIGFISTYDWGENLGIYIPDYTLYSEDISNIPMTLADFNPSSISESIVTMSQEVYTYGDTLFSAGTNNYKVLRYIITSEDEKDDEFEIYINASMGFNLQMWYKKESSSTVTRIYSDSSSRNGNKHFETVYTFNNYKLQENDTVYFVIYNPTYKGINGSICMQNLSYADDVTGSAYEQYSNNNSINYATYTPGYDEDEIKQDYGYTYYMNNLMDVDSFYINNTSGNENSYSIVFDNIGQIDSGKQSGTAIDVTLYYVDFDDDSHFVLKKQASTRIYAKDESKGRTGIGNINFAPKNNLTKYFFEVEAVSLGNYTHSEYNFYTMFYIEN